MATAKIETTVGVIEIELLDDAAPKTVENFVTLAKKGFYDGVIFHRVVPGFVIQGGDPEGTGMGGPGYKFDDEPVTMGYARGTVAMANSGPNTNGSQFFICVTETAFLDGQYSAFGEVIEGMDVADKIVAKPRDPRDNPKDRVTMKAKLGRPKS